MFIAGQPTNKIADLQWCRNTVLVAPYLQFISSECLPSKLQNVSDECGYTLLLDQQYYPVMKNRH